MENCGGGGGGGGLPQNHQQHSTPYHDIVVLVDVERYCPWRNNDVLEVNGLVLR